MSTPVGQSWVVKCEIGGVPVGGHVVCFEWKSVINGGFIVRAKVSDPYFQILDQIIENTGTSLLPTARQFNSPPFGPTLMTFKIGWDNGYETKERIALVSDVHATGSSAMAGQFEFIAIDPISYYVNSGDCSGKAYRGKIGGSDGVIAQVLNEYIPDPIGKFKREISVGDTDDQPNVYHMMRQDPKTFIASLLSWSSSFTKHQTSWLVANGEEEDKILKINVEESWTPRLKYPGGDDPLILSYGALANIPVADITRWELLTDNFISALNIKLVTSGLSAVSGEYFDRTLDKDEKYVFVTDKNTAGKTNTRLTRKHSFTKPTEEKRGWTHIMAVPEVYSAGDCGRKYKDYISGRGRQTYLEMLDLLMRMRLTVRGQHRLYDSTELGRTKVTVRWLKPAEDTGGTKPRFIDGDWLMYGWYHKLRAGSWHTDLYLARLDWDAEAARS